MCSCASPPSPRMSHVSRHRAYTAKPTRYGRPRGKRQRGQQKNIGPPKHGLARRSSCTPDGPRRRAVRPRILARRRGAGSRPKRPRATSCARPGGRLAGRPEKAHRRVAGAKLCLQVFGLCLCKLRLGSTSETVMCHHKSRSQRDARRTRYAHYVAMAPLTAYEAVACWPGPNAITCGAGGEDEGKDTKGYGEFNSCCDRRLACPKHSPASPVLQPGLKPPCITCVRPLYQARLPATAGGQGRFARTLRNAL